MVLRARPFARVSSRGTGRQARARPSGGRIGAVVAGGSIDGGILGITDLGSAASEAWVIAPGGARSIVIFLHERGDPIRQKSPRLA